MVKGWCPMGQITITIHRIPLEEHMVVEPIAEEHLVGEVLISIACYEGVMKGRDETKRRSLLLREKDWRKVIESPNQRVLLAPQALILSLLVVTQCHIATPRLNSHNHAQPQPYA